MAYDERTLNTEVTTTLSIVLRGSDGVETAIDADATPTAEIHVLGVLVQEIDTESVTHEGTGSYSFTWTPTQAAVHVITWSFAVGGGAYESEEKIRVVADVEGTSDSVPDDEEEDAPDLAASRLCTVTGTFYDAGGRALQGVYVRFTPDRDTTQFLSSGIVASEVTAESDESGALSLTLVRGVTGTLAITGLGVVRQVTVPDQGAITLKGLAELGDDPLEVQKTRFKKLPRRS
jgi:hypothetical protein